MPITLTPTDPDHPAAQFCLGEYFALLAARIPNLPSHLFPLPDPKGAEYRPPSGAFLLALEGEAPQGCVSLRRLSPEVGEIKRLWIAPAARGQGLARRLMDAIEVEAQALGYQTLKLDTNEHLPEAVSLYLKTGWTPTAPYSPHPATHWFAKNLPPRSTVAQSARLP